MYVWQSKDADGLRFALLRPTGLVLWQFGELLGLDV